MGVKDLWKLLEPAGRPVKLESLEGLVVGVGKQECEKKNTPHLHMYMYRYYVRVLARLDALEKAVKPLHLQPFYDWGQVA